MQNLLSGVGDGELELVDTILREESGLSKLLFGVAGGGVLTFVAYLICSLCNVDPWGGASLSGHSLHAAGVGLLASAPLAIAKFALWSDELCTSSIGLEQLRRDKLDTMRPLLSNMTASMMVGAAFLETVPSLLVSLPAAQGGLRSLFRDVFAHTPDSVPVGLALGVVVFVAAAGSLMDGKIDDEEIDVVRTAVDNSERYYRTMSPETAAADAAAFKAVAGAWMQQQRMAGNVSAALNGFEMLWLGLLWYGTGDLTAPLVAALAASAVDYVNLWKRGCGSGKTMHQ